MKIVFGAFTDPEGNVAAGATASFVLSSPQNTSYATIVRERVQVVLDSDGAFNIELYGNDEFQTAGSWYTVSVVDTTFGRIYYADVQIIGNTPINFNELVPIYVK